MTPFRFTDRLVSREEESFPMLAAERMSLPRLRVALVAVLAVLLAGGLTAASASAASPAWSLSAVSGPTNFAPGSSGDTYTIVATNTGGAPASGPVTVTDTLPAGLVATSIGGSDWDCDLPSLTCTSTVEQASNGGASFGDALFAITLTVTVQPGAPDTVTNVARVSGGGAPACADAGQPACASAITPTTISAQNADFAIAPSSFFAAVSTTQAGAHPDAMTSFAFTTGKSADGVLTAAANARNVTVDIPKGLIGNPQAVPQCPQEDFNSGKAPTCSVDTQLGTATVSVEQNPGSVTPVTVPVYSLVPPAGQPAQFGFVVLSAAVVVIDASVRSNGDYGLTTKVRDASAHYTLFSTSLTLWGVPADPSHDRQRCQAFSFANICTDQTTGAPAPTPSGQDRLPFLTNPTECPADPAATVSTNLTVESWQHPGVLTSYSALSPAPTGCDALSFTPGISVTPDTTQADTPAGYTVVLSVPQTSGPDELATAELKDAVVTLPAGVRLAPGVADGLGGCPDVSPNPGDPGFNEHDGEPANCPESSKLGTVRVSTPLLDHDLLGYVYLRQPDPGADITNRYQIFLDLEDPVTGIIVKLRGRVAPDPVTGQLTTTFADNPQLPFTNFILKFKGGARAPLVNPSTCGVATTTASLASWSGKAAAASDSFTVDADGAGGACPVAWPFAPTFSAGMTDPAAGGSSAFTLTIGRGDREQNIDHLDVTLPPGLLANLKGVPFCAEEATTSGDCDPASQVGETTVAAGAGDHPLFVPQPGKSPTAVYFAGPYKGAPFSLVIKVPAQAGPFDLGVVTVRAALYVDRHDAHVTVKSDPLPQILEGIPLEYRQINVLINRPGFMLNPTSCDAQQITSTITSPEGTTANLASDFKTSGCAALPFNPQFSAKTSAKLKFKGGASFKVHVAIPPGDANIKSLATTLPKELPSRLIPTINNACVYAQFQADYNGCPADSFVGTVSAVTPILDEPLTGPVYIVAPPNDVPRLEIVLLGQGRAAGIRVDLEGDVIVDSGGGRSKVTFAAVPDVPVTSFDVDLPAGPHSILDAPSFDLCKGPITMGLTVIGQNGKRSDSNPTIAVSDCPKIPKVKVVSAKATKTGVSLRVLAPSEGRLVISGSGLKTVGRTVNRKLTYSVKLPLTAAGKRAVSRKGRLKTRPTVYFKPVNAPKASTVKAKALTVKKHAAKQHARST